MIDIGSIASAVTGFFGGIKKPPSPVSPNVGIADGALPAPPPRSFADDLKSDAKRAARNAIFAPIEATVNGRAQRAFNKQAFPGTTSWEQLGSGNASGGSSFSENMGRDVEVQQRDRESNRQASVQLQSQRMQAATSLATEMIRQGGSANSALVAQLIRAGGILPPEHGFKPEMMARGKLEAEIDKIDADTRSVGERLPYEIRAMDKAAERDDASARLSSVEAYIKPYQFALDEWAKKYEGGALSKEVRGISAIIGNGLNTTADPNLFATRLVQWVRAKYGPKAADSFASALRSVP